MHAAPAPKKNNLVLFLASAAVVFLVSGVCVGGIVLYALMNR